MRAVVIGAVESTRIAIERIARAPDWSLPLVVTLPHRFSHRHSDYVDLADPARIAGAALYPAANGNAPETLEAIRAAGPDYIFIVGWSQIANPDLIAIPRRGTIGYHPAPLPRMRGRAVIPWTILTGEPITGGTLFWIDEGVDSGPILRQGFFHVGPDETATTLYARHMQLLERLMDEALAALSTDAPPREAQDERFATWTARRTLESGRIDWAQDATSIDCLVRAVARPYPGARTKVAASDDDLIIWRARTVPAAARHQACAGQVIARSDSSFTVLCGGGTAIEVTEWESGDASRPSLHAQFAVRP